MLTIALAIAPPRCVCLGVCLVVCLVVCVASRACSARAQPSTGEEPAAGVWPQSGHAALFPQALDRALGASRVPGRGHDAGIAALHRVRGAADKGTRLAGKGVADGDAGEHAPSARAGRGGQALKAWASLSQHVAMIAGARRMA